MLGEVCINATYFSFVLCLLIYISLVYKSGLSIFSSATTFRPGHVHGVRMSRVWRSSMFFEHSMRKVHAGACRTFHNIMPVPQGCGSAECANLNKMSSLTFTSLYIYALLTAQELPRTLPPRSSNLVEQCICYDITTMAISA